MQPIQPATPDARKPGRRFGFVRFSVYLALVLAAASWAYIFVGEQASLAALFSAKNLHYAVQFLKGMAGIGEASPAFLDIESWKRALALTYQTLQMSLMAIGFATIGMLLTVIPASRVYAGGSESAARRWYNRAAYGLVRAMYVVSRSVPELIWAMMIIFFFKPGLLPGAIALALHNFGILGKLCAEVIEDLDMRPIRNLASSGASKAQILVYGIIPAVLPRFLTYILYRWEVIIRTTIVVGFVGAGGLGLEFKLSMSWFHYTELTLYLMCYLLLVFAVDLISAGLRKWMQ
ncbi:ABC transporter permease subunit [Xylanibacillus composti]|uniref:ABC transmembrane type-1 domain-containing protein n=1 Tax=Xylanibacillus composti TaxID=1572762 RepID=A0A8J4H5P1_9BACL|nr:ABC transporter permease subunit [Xylanibacillus composti]MDT9725379.1 ABC transporter permease subunit [Xylanibacillus composti]GIQ69143.1 hypothetical protein XYCOK13_19670 [Xylanibacillus composti]